MSCPPTASTGPVADGVSASIVVELLAQQTHGFQHLLRLRFLTCYTLDQAHVLGTEQSCSLVTLSMR